MKNENLTTNDIKNKIYTIRGQKVMLDSDLAQIYGYEVKTLNQQVKRNIERFPEDFLFQLTKDEIDSVKSQIVTSRNSNFYTGQSGGTRYRPYAFTEQGIYMLATVLRGKLAEKQSIFLIRAFKQMKDYLQENRNLISPLEENNLMVSFNNRLDRQEVRVDTISKQIDEINKNFIDGKIKQICILNNQKFEADLAYIELIKEANESIYLIDNYPGNKTLKLLSNKHNNVNVILFTENKGNENINSILVNGFNLQYPKLQLKPNKLCHDRYFIIDYGTNNEKIYHLGASIKDGGKKISTINQLIDNTILENTINKLLREPDIIL